MTSISIRASSIDRILACNGSLLASPLVPKPKDSADSTEGSLLHYLIASRLVKELGAIEPEGGLVAPSTPPGYKLAAFSAWIVDWAVEWVRDNIPSGWSIQVEVPLEYAYPLPRPVTDFAEAVDIPGHLDLLAQSPDGKQLHGADWKTGLIGADPAEENWQAATYLMLAKTAWPETESAKFTLAQPRIDEEATGIQRVTTTVLNGQQLDALPGVIVQHINQAIENRHETNSGPKQCKHCPVALMRPWECPSLKLEEHFLKAKLTPEILERLKAEPDDATLGDFVISARTLAAPVEAATAILRGRIDQVGYVDAGCGSRITQKTRAGRYEVQNPVAFFYALRNLLGDDARVARVMQPSMTLVKDEIADLRGLPKSSKKGESAQSVFDVELGSLVKQGESKVLVIT